ncbi:HAD domain-containing protein [Aureivirga sp. CE67]|uniref:HAD domain-containing protein n=1 Tax=Aureivirga sp. CE67 TaxID=1788983 RepID=UPI0018C8E7B8|nr:HAD domain-containing protein [Aureivirga sp. CE67]
MECKILILDLDGVLITTPPWKQDEMDSDNYSRFNSKCVQNLNQLLQYHPFEIWLSSTRRTVRTLEEFNAIFAHRNIVQTIQGFVPEYPNCKSRKEEIEQFIKENNIENFLILDDDKSLHSLNSNFKNHLVSTELTLGFNEEKLEESLEILNG